MLRLLGKRDFRSSDYSMVFAGGASVFREGLRKYCKNPLKMGTLTLLVGYRYANIGAEGFIPASATFVHLTTLGLVPGPLGGPWAQHGKRNGV